MTLIASALPFFYFLFVASVTPGPNNVMLTASGMNFGYWKTVPHMLGIYAGFLTLLVLCTFGVGALYESYPAAQILLKALGAAYLLYLSYRILTAGRIGLEQKTQKASRPLKFIEAYGFQFINPKGIVFGLSATTLLPEQTSFLEQSFIVVFTTTLSCLASTNIWVLFGKAIAKLFRSDKTRQIINIILVLLLLATLPMMIFG